MGISHLWLLLAALMLDAAVGDPAWLWRRLPHPVVLAGGAIGWLDRRLNRETVSEGVRRLAGIVALLLLVIGGGGLGWLLHRALGTVPHGWVGEIAKIGRAHV